jgi:putative Mn2+ efflux pump MntP
MNIITTVSLAVGLSMDALAVAIAAAIMLDELSPRRLFRLTFHLGLFQALMPIIGWLAGLQLERHIRAWDHWVAFTLLTFIGVKAIHAALSVKPDTPVRSDPTRGLTLMALALATSIDALAAGASLAMLRVSIWYPSIVIGCCTTTITALGMLVGKRLGRRFATRIEVAGGIVLIALGLKILLEHIR